VGNAAEVLEASLLRLSARFVTSLVNIRVSSDARETDTYANLALMSLGRGNAHFPR
jgi:hypothetical protein